MPSDNATTTNNEQTREKTTKISRMRKEALVTRDRETSVFKPYTMTELYNFSMLHSIQNCSKVNQFCPHFISSVLLHRIYVPPSSVNSSEEAS